MIICRTTLTLTPSRYLFMKLTVSIFLCLIFVAVVPTTESAFCTPNTEPVLVTEEIADPEFIIDFDGLVKAVGQPLTVSKSGPVDVTLTGTSGCFIANNMGFAGSNWESSFNWTSGDGSPGDFMIIAELANEYCVLTFSEPISYFSMRTAAAASVTAGMFLKDESDQTLNCQVIPFPNSTTGEVYNVYTVLGFVSQSKNIKSIKFMDGLLAIDLLRGSRCGPGNSYVEGSCLTPCDMNPCGSNATCTNNVNGTRQCICNEYYQGDATVVCEPWSCATQSSQCSSKATCADVANEPFINCTCNSGYTGSGYGPNGCMLVAEPISSPISPPTSAPLAVPTSTPNKKVSASSFMAPLLWLTWCSWFISIIVA